MGISRPARTCKSAGSRLARVPEGEVREERIGKREFQIDLEAGTVTCPQGHVVAIPERARKGGERVVNFGVARCEACPLKSRCAPHAGGRKLTIARREDLLQAGRAALQDGDTEEPYDAPGRGSNASSAYSLTVTTPARTGTSAAP